MEYEVEYALTLVEAGSEEVPFWCHRRCRLIISGRYSPRRAAGIMTDACIGPMLVGR